MQKTRLVILFTLALLCVFIYRFNYSVPIVPLSTRIAVAKTPLSASFYVAQSQGYFAKNGLNVDINDVVGGGTCFNAVITKNADFGTSSESVLMFNSQQKLKFSTLATFVESKNDIKMILDKRQTIETIHDLKNKKIGVIKNTASEYFLSLMLALNKMDKNDVTVVSLQANQMLEALNTQQVQAVSTWEPYAYMIIKSLQQKALIVDANNIYRLTFNLVSKSLDDDESFEKSIRVLKSLKQANDFIHKNPQQAKQIVKTRLGLQQDFIDWVWDDYFFQLSLNNSLLLTLKDEAFWAESMGLLNKQDNIKFSQLFDARPLKKVLPSAVTL